MTRFQYLLIVINLTGLLVIATEFQYYNALDEQIDKDCWKPTITFAPDER